MSLKLVRNNPESDFDAGEISPILKDTNIHYSLRQDGVHQFDIGAQLNGSELAESLSVDTTSLPSGEFESFSHVRTLRAIRAGLKTLTYPNSRIMRHAKYVNSDARTHLRNSRQDIVGLVDSIEHPEHHRMVPAKLHVYGGLTGQFEMDAEINEALRDLKPNELRKLCEEYGVTIDEVALRRARGRDKDNYIDVADIVDDPETLKFNYRLNRFKPATVLPDEDEIVQTDAEDWPKDKWSEKAHAIQFLNVLPPLKSDSLGLRWNVLIRDDSSARHVVRPRLLVKSYREERLAEVAQDPHHAHAWSSPDIQLVFESEPPIYDRTTHTITHVSPILGAVMLMRSTESDVSSLLQKVIQGKEYRHGKHADLPDKVLGLSPLLLQSNGVQGEMFSSATFSRLCRHVYARL